MLILNHNLWHQYSTVPSGSKNPLHIRLNIKKMKNILKIFLKIFGHYKKAP